MPVHGTLEPAVARPDGVGGVPQGRSANDAASRSHCRLRRTPGSRLSPVAPDGVMRAIHRSCAGPALPCSIAWSRAASLKGDDVSV